MILFTGMNISYSQSDSKGDTITTASGLKYIIIEKRR